MNTFSKYLCAIAFAMIVIVASPSLAHAQTVSASSGNMSSITESYTPPTYEELVQTLVVLGTYDITDPKVAEDYVRLVYCNVYKKYHDDDFKWSAIRKAIIDRVFEKKEMYRIQYEIMGVVNLERYDIERQMFPLTKRSALNNVGRINLMSYAIANPLACPQPQMQDTSQVFPFQIDLYLNNRLKLDALHLPQADAQLLVDKIQQMRIIDRAIFVRIRFRIVDIPRLVINKRKKLVTSAQVKGQVMQVDYFLDSALTKWIASESVDMVTGK